MIDGGEIFFLAATNLDPNGSENQLIEDLNKIEYDTVCIESFLHFYSIAVYLGLLNVGFSLRKTALDTAIYKLFNNQYKTEAELLYGLAAIIEQKNDLLINFNSYSGKISNKHALSFNHLSTILHDSCLFDTYKKVFGNSEEDKSFEELICNKSVAIVGPAKSEGDNGLEIDSYDFVIRCNQKKELIKEEYLKKGKRCDITYYNREQKNFLIEEQTDGLEYPHDLKWVVTKSDGDTQELVNYLKKNYPNYAGKINVRALSKISLSLFNGTLNAIPNIVLDIMRFRPSKIKIFHADLMITVDRDKGYYPKEWNREEKMQKDFLVSSSRKHDPLTQFHILNSLWKNERLIGDEKFNYVMELGSEKYMQKLQSIYGKAGRI